MSFIKTVELYLALSLVLFLLISVVAVILFFLLRRKKKSIAEINYDKFERNDVLDYVKFDKILATSEDGEIARFSEENALDQKYKGPGVIELNSTKFVAAIQVTGYDFYHSSYDKQKSTINAMISLINSLEYPVQFRETSKAINIEHNIEVFEQRDKVILGKIDELKQNVEDLLEEAEDYIGIDEKKSMLYKEDASKLMMEIRKLQRQHEEARAVINYMGSISTKSGESQKVQNIVFSYTFDPTQFTSARTQEEVEAQALVELRNRGSNLISSLYRCDCIARFCTAEELVDLMRRHAHPVTGDDISVRDWFGSSLTSLFITSDSLVDTVREQMTEEAYEELIRDLNAQVEERLKRQVLADEKAEAERLAEAEKIARKQVVIE